MAPRIWGEGAEFRADPWILDFEAGVLDAILDRDNQRFLKGNAPSQIGKSTWEEVFLPFWVLGMFPETRIILACYNDTLAQVSGGQVRDLVRDYGPLLFNIDVDPDYGSRGDWRLAGHRGGMLSVGIGSTITGRSADLFLIGDVIKNMQEAASKAAKDWHWSEFQGSILTRVQPGSTYILACTRFADDDLSGRIDTQCKEPDYDGDIWETYVYKAIAEPDDDEEDVDENWRDRLGRVQGEPLQTRFSKPGDELPENWHNSHFYRVKRRTIPSTFAAIYQANPLLATGGMFPVDKWTWYDPDDIPRLIDVRRVWDLAASESEGDWSVGQKVAKVDDNLFYVLDVKRERLSGMKVKTMVEETAAVDGVACPIMIEEEKSGAGKTVVSFYQAALPLYDVKPALPDGTKEARARPASLLQQAGCIKLPRYADGTHPEWVADYIDELKRLFGDGRKGKHDDQIDTLAYAINDMLDDNIVQMINPALAMVAVGARAIPAEVGFRV